MRKEINLIYILGNSYSGSTILGFILGSAEGVMNLGELKFFNRLVQKGDNYCSCGNKIKNCDFWRDVLKKEYKIYGLPSSKTRLKIILDIILNKKFPQSNLSNSDEYSFLSDISKKGNCRYFVDASKSIWRLIFLMKCRGINLKVIHLERDIYGNVYSFIKHKKSFLKGLFIYKFNNYLIKKILKSSSIDCITLNYHSLSSETEKELKRIEKFLGICYSDYIKNMKRAEYHNPAGNCGVVRQFRQKFKGLTYDSSYNRNLNSIQKFILRLFDQNKCK